MTRELVERARQGDLVAFTALVERYQDAVYGTAYAMLGNVHDAQDVAQEVFIQVWRSIRNLRDAERFPGWIHRATRNRCNNVLTRSRHVTTPLEERYLDLHASSSSAGEDLNDTVREAIAALSEPNRLATALFYVGGYSIEEVATLLGVPAGTVKRRLHDSRKLLRERMEDVVRRAVREGRPSRDGRFVGMIAALTAIQAGDAARARALLLAAPVLAHERDSHGWTLLHHAARHGQAELAEVLLEAGADACAREDAWGWTPLHLAAEHGHMRLVLLLEAHGAEVELVAAAGLGKTERVAALLADHPELARELRNGSSPLHWAAYYGHTEIVRLLLEAGADVHARSRNEFGNSPLHCAALHGHVEAARLLLAHGADPMALDAYGATPVHAVLKYPHSERDALDAALLDLMLAYGADLITPNERGETALHWAATHGERRLAPLLQARGATLDIYAAAGLGDIRTVDRLLAADPALVNAPGPDRMTPLHFAAYGGSPRTIARLLASGADLHARGGWFGGTPLHAAAYVGDAEVVRLLLAHGAFANATDGDGWTPLHQFRFPWWMRDHRDRVGVARALLAHGADVNASTAGAETPLHLAAHYGDSVLATVLLAAGADVHALDDGGRTPLDRALYQTRYDTVTVLENVR